MSEPSYVAIFCLINSILYVEAHVKTMKPKQKGRKLSDVGVSRLHSSVSMNRRGSKGIKKNFTQKNLVNFEKPGLSRNENKVLCLNKTISF